MALKHAILAALREESASGYELSKRFDISVANFWAATPQQIYRELERLEEDGLVEAELVEQSSRPNKRVFTVAPAGLEELDDFVAAAPKPTAIRDDLLVKVAALDESNTGAVAGAVRERLAQSEAKLDLYERLRSKMLGDLEEEELMASSGSIGSYLTLLRGISFEEGNRDWCRSVLEIVDGARSGTA